MEMFSLLLLAGYVTHTVVPHVAIQSEDACLHSAKQITAKMPSKYPYAMCINEMTGDVFIVIQGKQVDKL